MCGQFTATFEFSDIRVRWKLDRDLPKYTPRFNIAPEQISPTIPVIVRRSGGNECRLMHLGLILHGAADPGIGNRSAKKIGHRKEFLREILKEVRVRGNAVRLPYKLPMTVRTPLSEGANPRTGEFFTLYQMVGSETV